MDEQTATRLAAQQLVDQLGKPAGFMIALRIMQVIAERTSPVTPELVEAFAAALKSMERFAEMAGLDREGGAPTEGRDEAAAAHASDGAGPAVVVTGEHEGNGADGRGKRGGVGGSGNGTPLA
jgi:hypothetical protein